MGYSRKGLDKAKKEQEESVAVSEEIEPGYVYVVDYLVNKLIKGTTSYSVKNHDMTIRHIHKKLSKTKIHRIEIMNPRSRCKQL